MTVFDMTDAAAADKRMRSGRLKMILVMLMCAAPVIASYFMYYVVRPEGRRNYGELIEPQRPLPDVLVTGVSGTPVDLKSLRDFKYQWLLISVSSGDCPAICEKNLYLQRQLRESMGRDKGRVDWVWLRTDTQALPERLTPALTEATVLEMSEADASAWLTAAPGKAMSDHLYVVDPLGNLMMRFPADLDPKQARKDLTHLLKASSSWDNEGRQR